MSYILDALRRANAERERGTVPTLHTDPGPADRVPDDEERGASRSGLSPWIAGVGGALVIALGAYWLWPAKEEVQVVAVVPAPAQAPIAVQPTPPANVQVQRPQVSPAVVPLTVPPLLEQPKIAAAPAPVAPASQAVPTKAELPEDVRRQLPPLVTSGAMYSDTPANRMVIINGQLLHEGDKVTPDLVLEQIMLKGAVLSLKGQRFSISY